MKGIDLNADLGEGQPFDQELLALATSANVCCGEHAGSLELTRETVDMCRSLGVRVGAHPGVPDRASMGRASLPEDLVDVQASLSSSLTRQIEFLAGLGAEYVKPHGEAYNASAKREDVCELLAGVLRSFGLPLMGLPGTLHERLAEAAGIPLIREGFADRRYTPEGTLVPRTEPGAVLTDPDEAAAQAVALAPKRDSLCVHGDSPGCVAMLRAVRLRLLEEGFEVRA